MTEKKSGFPFGEADWQVREFRRNGGWGPTKSFRGVPDPEGLGGANGAAIEDVLLERAGSIEWILDECAAEMEKMLAFLERDPAESGETVLKKGQRASSAVSAIDLRLADAKWKGLDLTGAMAAKGVTMETYEAFARRVLTAYFPLFLQDLRRSKRSLDALPDQTSVEVELGTSTNWTCLRSTLDRLREHGLAPEQVVPGLTAERLEREFRPIRRRNHGPLVSLIDAGMRLRDALSGYRRRKGE